jgi:hypothetical protein
MILDVEDVATMESIERRAKQLVDSILYRKHEDTEPAARAIHQQLLIWLQTAERASHIKPPPADRDHELTPEPPARDLTDDWDFEDRDGVPPRE